MVSLPWYLLAVGIGIVILGFILAGLPGPSDRGRRPITHRMRDDDIVRELKRDQRVPFPALVVVLGLVCILASVVWRVARAVL